MLYEVNMVEWNKSKKGNWDEIKYRSKQLNPGCLSEKDKRKGIHWIFILYSRNYEWCSDICDQIYSIFKWGNKLRLRKVKLCPRSHRLACKWLNLDFIQICFIPNRWTFHCELLKRMTTKGNNSFWESKGDPLFFSNWIL